MLILHKNFGLFFILTVLLLICNPCSAYNLAQGTRGMVVTAQPLATQVGINTLRQGGNAIDAAVSIGYALAVVHPCCGNIGGGGFMLIHLANGKNTVINFREKAPQAIRLNLFRDKHGNLVPSRLTNGYLAIGVPGTVLGLNSALEKYGTLPLNRVMQPAINLAKNGFILTSQDTDFLDLKTNAFKTNANVAAIFLNNGNPFSPGQRLVQKNLAKTLETIATEKANAFYHGKIAKEIVKASQQNGGVLTLKDFAKYTIEEQKPLICHYRGYKIITVPPPGSGATVCEILNITEDYPLQKLGLHSALATHYIIEAMRYSYADRNTYLADPDFVKIPLTKLLSQQHAETIRQRISPNHAGNSHKIKLFISNKEKEDTTSYAVADKYGNVVVVTYTLNGYFGANVIAGDTGFFLNNELDDFTSQPGVANYFGLIQGKANIIAPNKRPLSSIAPIIIFKNNKFFMAGGTPGGSTIPTTTIQTIENIIDYGLNIQTAVSTPKFHMQWLPDLVYREPYAFTLAVKQKLKSMGYHFKLGSPYGTLRWGAMVGIIYNIKTHQFEGAIDERKSSRMVRGY